MLDQIRPHGLDALRDYQSAFEHRPYDFRLWNLVGIHSVRAGKLEDGIAEWRKLLAAAPTYVPARRELVNTLRLANRLDDAAGEIADWFRLDPKPFYPLIEVMALRGYWQGERLPTEMTPALRQAFARCLKDNECG